jgi:hypothetical protein
VGAPLWLRRPKRVVVLAEDVAQPLVEIAERPAQVLVADF